MLSIDSKGIVELEFDVHTYLNVYITLTSVLISTYPQQIMPSQLDSELTEIIIRIERAAHRHVNVLYTVETLRTQKRSTRASDYIFIPEVNPPKEHDSATSGWHRPAVEYHKRSKP
jgi:hypothetical protein